MIAALGSLAKVAASRAQSDAHRDRLKHEIALAELQSDSFKTWVNAVIGKQLEMVEAGFIEVLKPMAEQARHYMDEQKMTRAAELSTNDPLRRVELRKRLNDIDISLQQIRIDARLLYDRMTEVVLLLNTKSLPLDTELSAQLGLSPSNY